RRGARLGGGRRGRRGGSLGGGLVPARVALCGLGRSGRRVRGGEDAVLRRLLAADRVLELAHAAAQAAADLGQSLRPEDEEDDDQDDYELRPSDVSEHGESSLESCFARVAWPAVRRTAESP